MGVLGAARRAAPGCDVHQVVVRDVGALEWWLAFCVLCIDTLKKGKLTG